MKKLHLAFKSSPFGFGRLLTLAAFVAALALAPRSLAANGADYWVGNTSVNFGDANWTGVNNPPLSGDSWIFGPAGTAGAVLNNNLTALNTCAGLTNFFNSAGSAFTINGNSITLGGDIGDFALNTQTINFPIALSASRNVTVAAGGGTLALGGVVSGSAFGLTKYGAGTLTLTNANTYTGGTVVRGGTLLVDFSSLATPTDLINSASAPTLNGGDLLLKGKSSGATSQTLGALTAYTGGGKILINPNGGTGTTLNLGAISSVTQGTFNHGYLLVGTAAGAGSGTVTVTTTTKTNSAASAIYGGLIVYTSDGGTTVDWATSASASSPYTLSAYSGYTTLPTSVGSSAVNYKTTAGSTLTGNLAANTLKIENPAANQTLDLGGNTLTMNERGLLVSGSNGFTITNGTIVPGGGTSALTVQQYNTGGLNIAAVITNNGATAAVLTKTGPGTLTNSAANTYSGGTYLNGGILNLNATETAGTSGPLGKSGNISFFGGTLQYSSANTYDYSSRISAATGQAVSVDTAGQNVTWATASRPSGAGTSLTKSGAGTLTLSGGGYDYTGATTINNGTVLYSGANQAVRTSAIYINNGSTFTNSTAFSSYVGIYGFDSAGGGTIGLGAVPSINNPVTFVTSGGARDVIIGTSANYLGLQSTASITFDVAVGTDPTCDLILTNGTYIFGTKPFTKTGAGRLMLLSPSDTASAVTINAGTLIIGGAGKLFAGTTLITNNGAITYNSTAAQTYSAVISGTGSLTQAGTGTLTLSGANTYTGNTTISGGTLALSGSGAINSSATLSIAAGGTFDASLLASPYTLSGSTTLSASGTGTTLGTTAAAIKGASGGTVSLGSRPITLTYNGSSPALYISQGTLALNGNAFTVNSASPLTAGTYTLIQQASGNVSSNGTFTVTGTAIGSLVPSIVITGGNVNLVLTSPNQPPVAQNFSMGAVSGLPATVKIIGGKHSPSDPDNNPLVVSAVSPSGNASASTPDGTNIIYTASALFSGMDAFTYTVSDGFGGVSNGVVTVTVAAAGEGFNRLSPPTPIGSGQVVLTYLGIPGYNYALDWATNLSAPVNWLPVVTNMVATNGYLIYTNTSAYPANYFRTRHVP